MANPSPTGSPVTSQINPHISEAIEMADVLRGVARRWAMVLGLTVVACAMSVTFVTFAKNQYTSSAKVIVQNLATPYTRLQSQDRADTRIEVRDVLSQVEVITSRDLADEVIDRRISDKTRAMLSQSKRSLTDSILARIGLGSDGNKATERERAYASYDENLLVYPIQGSTVIVIEYRSGNPKVSADVVNAVANAYVQATQTAQAEPINVARGWLSEQIELLRDKVVKSEVAVEEYRAKAGLIRGSNATLNSQELSELNSQIILAAAARSEVEARAASIRQMLARTGTIAGASDVLNSQLIQRLREQQVRLRRRIADLSTTYLENHPRIVGARRELSDLDNQVRGEVLKVVNGLEQQAKIAAARETSLRNSLNGLKDKASSANVDEVKLRALQREATANRTLLETFLNRYNEASSREKPNAQPGLARIISSGVAPSRPSFPKKGPIVLLGTLAGLVVGIGLAFLMEVMAAAGRMQQAAQFTQHAAMQQHAATQPQAASLTVHSAPAVATDTRTAPRQSPASQPLEASPTIEHKRVEPCVVQPPKSDADRALCSIPASGDWAHAVQNAGAVLSDPADEYTTGVRVISSWATELIQKTTVKRLAVTAIPGAQIDAAAAAVSVARCLASQNLRVIVVDCDLEEGWAGKTAQLGERPGLAELAIGSAAFSDVIIPDQVSHAHFICIGQAVDQARLVLDKQRFDMVMDALEHAYDFVLVNTGKAEFPANQNQFALTSCQAALVMSHSEFAGPAATLCAALMQSGLQAAHCLTFSQVAPDIASQRIAAIAANG